MNQAIVYNAIQTPDGTVIESRHRHDYVTHTDANGKTYMVDGGLDYLRRTAHGDEVELSVSLDDGHEKVREVLTWGTRASHLLPLAYVKLCDMTTDHIGACLETQNRMHKNVRAAMQNELLFRSEPRTKDSELEKILQELSDIGQKIEKALQERYDD